MAKIVKVIKKATTTPTDREIDIATTLVERCWREAQALDLTCDDEPLVAQMILDAVLAKRQREALNVIASNQGAR